ncbi:MAG: PEGA domain-containing protein [Gallionella sp.]
MLSAHPAKSFIIFSLLLLAGCSSGGSAFPPAGNAPFKVESDPAGAAVYVMGENMGVTPMQLSHTDVFPNIYPREKESLYGKIILRKAGCKDYTRTVSGDITSFGLHAKLDCASSAPAPSAAAQAAPSETVEQRLDKIKELLNKGLISEDEAKKARARILNEL